MPPTLPPIDPSEKLLAPGRPSPIGPTVGIVIILILLIIGALYFWGAHLNNQRNAAQQLPLIPASTSTVSQ